MHKIRGFNSVLERFSNRWIYHHNRPMIIAISLVFQQLSGIFIALLAIVNKCPDFNIINDKLAEICTRIITSPMHLIAV